MTPTAGVPLREAVAAFARISALSFGGPAGQIAVMHRVLVDEKRWISEERFLHALNYCMLLPGPEAQQLLTYIGWLLHGTRGGLIAGSIFVLPGFVSVWMLSWLYAVGQGVPIVEGIFFGLKPAVLAVVIQAVLKLGSKALIGRVRVGVAVAAFAAIFFFDAPFPGVVAGAGLFGYLRYRATGRVATGGGEIADRTHAARPSVRRAVVVLAIGIAAWFVPVVVIAAVLGPDDVFTRIGLFFSKMAVVTFGGAYAALAYVAQEAVQTYAWLSPGEMLDGLGLAETTPGPLIMVLEYVGFLAAYREGVGLPPALLGFLGAALTTWVTFVPCFLWIFLGAPYVEALRGRASLTAALSMITAAVVGVILNLAVWFGLHVVFAKVGEWQLGPFRVPLPTVASVDPVAVLLATSALVALLRFRAPLLPTLATAALFGVILHPLA